MVNFKVMKDGALDRQLRMPHDAGVMKHLTIILLASYFAGLAGVSSAQNGRAPDALRGEIVHERCIQCHGTQVYVPRPGSRTLTDLRRLVLRWNESMKDPLNAQDLEDVLAYLNGSFYHLPQ